jgi:hypothetical protein
MCRSFAICEVNGKNEQITIEKFHLNAWIFKNNKLFIECGLLLKAKKEYLKTGFNLDLYTPFAIEGEIVDLTSKFANDNNVQMIFNEDIETRENISDITSIPVSRILFKSGDKFVFIKPTLRKINAERLNIEINADTVDEEKLDTETDTYIRFRFKVDAKKSSNIYTITKGFHDEIFLDIRINELRLFSPDELSTIFKNRVKINIFQLFVIVPISYKLSLDGRKEIRYMRFLEKSGFLDYIELLKKFHGDFIVYYWKSRLATETPEDDTFNMVVSFQKERKTLEYMKLVFFGIASLYFISLLKLPPRLVGIVNILFAAMGTILLGLIGTAIWDFIKNIWSFKKNRD